MMREDITEIQKKVHIYLSVGRYDAAEKLLKMAMDELGNAANLRNLLGVTYHRQSNFKSALEQFEQALNQNPEYTEAILNMAVTLADLGLYEDSAVFFQKAESTVNVQHGVPSLVLGRLANHHAQLGSLYESANMKQQALEEFRKALHLYPEMPDIRLKLARLLIETRDFEGARKELKVLENSTRGAAASGLWLGVIHYLSGSKAHAAELWQQAKKLRPNDRVSRAYSSFAYFIGHSDSNSRRHL
jgi:tetratricopeptide (TPR) repeat protein